MFTYHLLRPFSYWTIKFNRKALLDWGYPFVAAALTAAVVFGLSRYQHVTIFGDSGLIAKLISFVQNLPGFYIAALAAIATFNRVDIDRAMPAPTPKINIQLRGQTVAIELTRRRFLCALLAFLTAESLLLILSGILALVVAPSVKAAIPAQAQPWIVVASSTIYLVFFWQMLIVTFLGLFYLGDRIHQPDDQ
ncbi:hypothetical protein ACI2VH_16080 [Ralstonia nicotianae]|uniref:Transmembrane protein n=1 Tax=Ralstonia nicotianae TaxID=3037696 RepID=A0ABX7ZNM6_9RALS|nr:hypothetical protein [Ralstonia nicotianae]QUP57058.1 hypothetical protein GO999_00020 [Ralstonia nicotianae]